MGFLGQFTNQIGGAIKSQSAARRLMMLLIVGGSGAGLFWLALSAKNGTYQTLYTNLGAQDMAEARLKLASMSIDSRVENGGTTLLVPGRRADEALMSLALEGIPTGGTVGMELMDKSAIGSTKFQLEKNYHRMREGELARTLMTLKEVERARVHLALPEDSLFVKDQKPPTASVVLKLRQGCKLDSRQLTGIVHLVAHSIEGLEPTNVSIIDNEGNLLNAAQDGGGQGGASTSQAGYKVDFEDQLKARVETMLENIVGHGKVAARVTADFDFSSMHQVSEKYDPDGQVVKSEQSSSESKGPGSGAANSGLAGSDSNLPGSQPGTADSTKSAGQNRVEGTKEFALSRDWVETQSSTPMPKKVSVALLVDGVYEETTGKDGKKTQQYRQRTDEELTKLSDLVKAAIGFTSNETRQDAVTVECLPFKVEAEELAPKQWLTYELRQMIELVLTWLVIGLVSLLFLFKILKPAMRQVMSIRVADAPGGLLMAGGPSSAMLAGLEPGSPEALEVLQKVRDGIDPNELSPEALAQLRQLEVQLGAQNERFQVSQMQAKSMNAQSAKVHKDVLDSAKNDPQRTVSLLRQWMDEA